MGDQELKIWTTFKRIYKQEFITANIVGWVIALVGVVLYINYQLLLQTGGKLSIIIPFAFYLLLFFYLIIALWSFPLLVHYNDKWFRHIRNAMIIGLTKIHMTIFMGIFLFSIVYLSLSYPGAIPFFTISLAAICCMWFALQVFSKMDEKMT